MDAEINYICWIKYGQNQSVDCVRPCLPYQIQRPRDLIGYPTLSHEHQGKESHTSGCGSPMHLSLVPGSWTIDHRLENFKLIFFHTFHFLLVKCHCVLAAAGLPSRSCKVCPTATMLLPAGSFFKISNSGVLGLATTRSLKAADEAIFPFSWFPPPDCKGVLQALDRPDQYYSPYRFSSPHQ